MLSLPTSEGQSIIYLRITEYLSTEVLLRQPPLPRYSKYVRIVQMIGMIQTRQPYQLLPMKQPCKLSVLYRTYLSIFHTDDGVARLPSYTSGDVGESISPLTAPSSDPLHLTHWQRIFLLSPNDSLPISPNDQSFLIVQLQLFHWESRRCDSPSSAYLSVS